MKMIFRSVMILTLLAVALGWGAYLLLTSTALYAAPLSHQKTVVETRPLDKQIDQVESNVPFDLQIVQGAAASLSMEGEQRLLPKVIVRQDGRMLHIKTSGMLVTLDQTLTIKLILPQLSALSQSGSGDSTVAGFNADALTLNHLGSGNLQFHGAIRHLAIQSAGSGDLEIEPGQTDLIELRNLGSGNVNLKGAAQRFKLVNSGSGNVEASELRVTQAEVVAQGSGDIELLATGSASVTNRGSGEIHIAGAPPRREVVNHGSGEISFR